MANNRNFLFPQNPEKIYLPIGLGITKSNFARRRGMFEQDLEVNKIAGKALSADNAYLQLWPSDYCGPVLVTLSPYETYPAFYLIFAQFSKGKIDPQTTLQLFEQIANPSFNYYLLDYKKSFWGESLDISFYEYNLNNFNFMLENRFLFPYETSAEMARKMNEVLRFTIRRVLRTVTPIVPSAPSHGQSVLSRLFSTPAVQPL